MRRLAGLTLVLGLLVSTPACYTFKHTVGSGPSTGTTVEEGQWFAFWGLWPLNPKDSKQLAGTATNYRATTKFTPLDVLISFFTAIVTIHKQTIIVEK